jgi:Glycosyl hydrolase catalytic core
MTAGGAAGLRARSHACLLLCRYTCNLRALQSNIQKAHRLFGRPIWVTEFNCPNAGGPVARQVSAGSRLYMPTGSLELLVLSRLIQAP